MPTIKVMILLVIAISASVSSANGRALLQNPHGDMQPTFYHHGHYFPPYGWPYGGGFGRKGGRFGSIGPGFGGPTGGATGSGMGGTGGELGTGGTGSENNGGGGDYGNAIGVEEGAFQVPGDGVEGGKH